MLLILLPGSAPLGSLQCLQLSHLSSAHSTVSVVPQRALCLQLHGALSCGGAQQQAVLFTLPRAGVTVRVVRIQQLRSLQGGLAERGIRTPPEELVRVRAVNPPPDPLCHLHRTKK